MIELFENSLLDHTYASSKGNQLKWKDGNRWYKSDQNGYEGLAEYTVSELLSLSDLGQEMVVSYRTEEIRYRNRILRGCSCDDFLSEGESLITLERLYASSRNGRSLYKTVFSIPEETDRVRFLVSEIQSITGISDFGEYLCLLLELDALFLNEDRHMHNIAVILQPDGRYRPSPVLDNGACLLSDTAMDYPLEEDIIDLLKRVKSKTISASFISQLDAVESLYPQQIYFCFTQRDVETILEKEPVYPASIKTRVRDILFQQMASYSYLF